MLEKVLDNGLAGDVERLRHLVEAEARERLDASSVRPACQHGGTLSGEGEVAPNRFIDTLGPHGPR